MSFFKKLFGIDEQKKIEKKSFELDPDAFYLWEDNYLMLEILPKENLEFIKNETKRIDEFSKENYNGLGYNMVTPIGNSNLKTIEKLIDIDSVLSVIKETQLKRVDKIGMIDVGILEDNDRPYAFGNKKHALLFHEKSGLLNDIWLEGKIETEEEVQQLSYALFAIGKMFNFVAVNWYSSTYFDLSNKEEAEDFVKTGLMFETSIK